MNIADYFDGSFELEKHRLRKKYIFDSTNYWFNFSFGEFDILKLFVGGESVDNLVNVDFDRLFIHLCL